MRQDGTSRVVAFTLYGWDHRSPVIRLLAPWKHADVEVLRGTQWDQVFIEKINTADLVILHRDFPRLAKAYQQIIQQARGLGKPVLFDLDELLFDLPEKHPDRQYHYISDALFPVLHAVLEADAVTVSTPALHEAIQPLNPNTLLLPVYLNDSIWRMSKVQIRENNLPLIIGWINDQLPSRGVDNCTSGLVQFLHQRENDVLLRVWGRRPPDSLLALPNVDWLTDIPTSYSQFATYFSKERIDLALIPHGDEPFDRCQSPLRLLEHSSCGTPGIYSRVSPYQDVISHNRNGWLASTAEEWLQALQAMFGSSELRGRIAASAQSSIQENWLLSQNAYRWKEIFDRSADLAEQHKGFQKVADQSGQISDQVRRWQRDLEARLHEYEWELRATNLMMRRQDRQAGQYIEQLGAQLEGIWSDPAWRMLNKAKKLVKMVTAPRIPATPDRGLETVTDIAVDTHSRGSTSEEGLISSSVPRNITPAAAFDLLWFSGVRWEELPEKKRSRAVEFASDGIRVVIVSQVDQPGHSPALRQVAEGIYELALPTEAAGQNSSGEAAESADRYQKLFAELRMELGIFEAVCFFDDPLLVKVGFRLRNFYGWNIAASPGQSGATQDSHNLLLRSDLVLQSPVEEMSYSAVRQELFGLYPIASIVILTYNNRDYTKQCLDSISTRTAYPNYEVIIVDNASTDDTVEYLHAYAASHPNVRLVLNEENRGFSTGNNQGVAESHGDYIVFLNNDTLVTQGWLSGLISHLRNPEIGAVGPVTNSSGNESKIGVDYSDINDMEDFARRYAQAHDGQAFEIRMLALYCMLVRRSVIDDVGLLDERFGVGMYEDDDFSLRIRQKGYRILCAEDVYIHHWGSASFSRLAEDHYQRLYLENRRIFEEKWGTAWQPHRWRMEQE